MTPARDERLSPQTIRAHVETLKAFFSWLHQEGYVDDNPLEHVAFPKVPQKLKEILSKEEVERLLSGCDRRNPVRCRNSTILMLLLDTGLRCAELTSCKLGDVHIDRGYLKVMGKGARERMVPIGVTVRKALVEYLRASRPGPASSQIDNLFLSEDGKPLLVGGVQLMLKRLGRRCGVPRLHTHLCRHTFATNYLINGGDLFTLQHILGHSSLEMVRRYVTLASGFVAMQHQRFSPLDKMYQGASRFGRGARFAEHLQQNQRFGPQRRRHHRCLAETCHSAVAAYQSQPRP